MLMLVEYLRDHAQFVKHRKPELSDMLAEAADEIERLRAIVREAAEAKGTEDES